MSTAVRDVSQAFLNQPASSIGRNTAAGGDFHKVWSNQMNRGATGGAVQDGGKQSQVNEQANGSGTVDSQEKSQAADDAVKEPEKVQETKPEEKAAESVKEDTPGKTADTGDAGEAGDTAREEQVRAMEILGTAAVKLMEQITEVFGISVEELQAVMDELGMDQADLLDAGKLGALLLQLGGAGDSYALITDEVLYDNYQRMMEQLRQVLQDGAGELGREPEELAGLLKEGLEEAGILQEQAPSDQAISGRAETVDEAPEAGTEPVLNTGAATDATQEGDSARQEGGRREREAAQPDHGEAGGNQVNLVLHNLRAEQFRPEMQQTGDIAGNSPWSADTRQIMDQIMDYMKFTLNADTTSLEMQLHPASLGTLQIQIASKGGVVTANFIAQNEAVKAALESQMVQLREQFEEQGVKVEAIEVTVQTHEFEQNLEQGRGRNHQETEKKGRGRRISLGGAFNLEDQEESLTEPDMMVTGSSTVSYTA